MFVPSFIALSMSSGLATPSWRRLKASFIIGTRSRFTTKPGDSFTSTGSFPSLAHRSLIRPTVASLVSEPRITSTSFMTGAGLKKCMPTTRSARFVAFAISVMLDDAADLGEDRIHFGGGHLALLDPPGEGLADAAKPAFDKALLDVPHGDLKARCRAGLRDARAHRPRPDNGNLLDLLKLHRRPQLPHEIRVPAYSLSRLEFEAS